MEAREERSKVQGKLKHRVLKKHQQHVHEDGLVLLAKKVALTATKPLERKLLEKGGRLTALFFCCSVHPSDVRGGGLIWTQSVLDSADS